MQAATSLDSMLAAQTIWHAGRHPAAASEGVASSAHAGLLWVYKRQQAADDTRSPWYLHGFFA